MHATQSSQHWCTVLAAIECAHSKEAAYIGIQKVTLIVVVSVWVSERAIWSCLYLERVKPKAVLPKRFH